MRFGIINGRVTRNNLGGKFRYGYFIRYAATTGVILYWKLDQPFVIHGAHHVWCD